MEDRKIVDLFLERSENAISESQTKYGAYCLSIAMRILDAREDAEECVNSAYLAAWNSIPPSKPEKLSTYLGKLVRNLAINVMIRNGAQKRRHSAQVTLDEISEFTPSPGSVDEIDRVIFKDLLDRFLASLPKKNRMIFMQRYWYMLSTGEISDVMNMSESAVKSVLVRTRKSFRSYLEKEGYTF